MTDMNIEEIDQHIKALEDATKYLQSQKPDDIEPVFPKKGHVIYSDGTISSFMQSSRGQIEQGNTFRTGALTKKESKRRAARKRVIEKINIANKGDGGFKFGQGNYLFEYDHSTQKLELEQNNLIQTQEPGLYFRIFTDSYGDPEFYADYKLMLGIEQ